MESTPKPSCLGISGKLLHWIRSFLTRRFQQVVINGNFLTGFQFDQVCTVLGPLLFLLYIDDLRDVSNATLKLFADDVALYCEVKSTADCSLLCSWATK